MEKSYRKFALKASPASPDPFLVLLNNPKKLLHPRNFFKNKVFWKRIIKNP